MKPLHIVVAAGLYPPDIGGPATYAVLIERELPKQGITVSVVPYRIVRALPKIFRHAAYAWRLWSTAGAADAIFALDPVSVGVPAFLVSLVRRRPLLLRLGGDYAWEQGQQRFGVIDTLDAYTLARKKAPWFVRCLHTVQSLVARQAAVVIVPSHYLGNVVETWGVSPKKIQVVYSALSPLPQSMEREVARRHFGLSGFVVVSAARLTPWKGMSALLTVLANLRAAGIDATLAIAGDGPVRAELEELAQAKGLSSYVHFLGTLTKVELGNLLSATDAFVLNTAYEGLSHQLLEVMAAGVPIVTTLVGGNPELIRNEENGLLVRYNDEEALVGALTSLACNQNQGAILARAAVASLAKFSEAATLTSLITLINAHARR